MATSFHYGIITRVTRSPHGRCIQRRNIGSILNYLHLTDTAHLCSFVLRNQLRSRYGRHNLITTRYMFYCQSKHLNVLCATKFLYYNFARAFHASFELFPYTRNTCCGCHFHSSLLYAMHVVTFG